MFIGLDLSVGAMKSYVENKNIQTSSSTKSKQTSTNSETKIYNAGTEVKLGNWQITVLGVEDKKTLKGSFTTKTTENNYIVVKLKIKNTSNEARSLLTNTTEVTTNSYNIYSRSILELYDGKSTYVANYQLEDYVNKDFDIFLNKVNPNTTITYNAVFETDLPSNQKEYKLKLNDNDKVFIRIK